MPKLISKPTLVQAAGNPPKQIEEFIGCVNSETSEVSIYKNDTVVNFRVFIKV